MLGYDPQILRRLQVFETDMLEVFDMVCTKYGIRYFAVFGTAIGAVRHHGFIPWDDDIDLGMMLEDYNRFLQIPKSEWDKYDMELITPYDFCPCHMRPNARLFKKHTVFEGVQRTKYDKPKGYPNHRKRPIWIDIFIYSHIKSPDIAKKYSKKMILYQRLFWRAKNGMKRISTDPFAFQMRCLRNDIIHRALSLIPGIDKTIFNSFYRIIENLDSAGGDYVTTFETEFIEEIILSVSKEEDMFPLVRVPFENIEITIQKNYHEMLTSIYGDYMKLPPPEKRINHAPAILDFGDGKGNVIKVN